MKPRVLTAGAVAALAALGLVAGCGSKDTGMTVDKAQVKSPAEIQSEIQNVQNNPNIPAGQKQAIIGRLQAQLPGAQPSEGQVRKSLPNPAGGGAPVPAAPK